MTIYADPEYRRAGQKEEKTKEKPSKQTISAGPKSHKATGQRNRNRDGNKTGTELNKHCTSTSTSTKENIYFYK
jgi:hypothetical protein